MRVKGANISRPMILEKAKEFSKLLRLQHLEPATDDLSDGRE